ncbi:MAG: electron transfer flavoprotein subunit alpha/FixB family protein [Bacteroidales bacterium]|jgi:electron transfer flavoprotein alpha subunit|nr:electron transfer flavoprotein subunit alpha/FixB family protein [Bacteroidales bacterium]
MDNVLVYCEVTEEKTIAEVSLELLSKGRKLANELKVKLEAVVISDEVNLLEETLYPYGVDIINYCRDERLFPYQTIPHFAIVTKLIEEEKPQIALFGATSIGRDLAPRVASYLRTGLTADCTTLEIGSHIENKTKKEYKDLLYQIRPAFGGNIIATIINPDNRPQMATVREGVMKKEIFDKSYKGTLKNIVASSYVKAEDFCLKIISRQIEAQKINIKGAQIIVCGGYGMKSRENFQILYQLAEIIQGEVGATRAAVDASMAEHERQIGQTGVTVRPKLYIACGVSGAVQHRAGMQESSKIISINIDPKAPINSIADYTIIGDVMEIVPKMIQYYKSNTK